MAKVCVALNTSSWKEARRLIDRLSEEADLFKVGLPLYLNDGREEVERLVREGVSIFLDLKLHDIPSVVAETVKGLPPVDYLTVHATGGRRMIEAATSTRPDIRVLAVTLLTSLSDEETRDIFKKKARKLVIQLSRMAADARAWGVVVPGTEARAVRKYFKMLGIVVPGVRYRRRKDDHMRSVPPSRLYWLSDEDIVVVGREITEAKDPVAALRRIREALSRRSAS
ncbi:MAG: orotidine-5'-phosphate decarboxylase [Thermotogae bacterium]|nr:orotidine-5'-phosphate decarboxylase [Thermotogota bacterium]